MISNKNEYIYLIISILYSHLFIPILSNKESPVFSKTELLIKQDVNMKINQVKTTIHIDPMSLHCNIKFTETVIMSFQSPTDRIYYIIISKKLLFKDFKPSLSLSHRNDDVSILKYEILNDLSYKQRKFYDENKKEISFRDKWLITLTLNKEVKEIQLNIEYSSDRALLVDASSKTNIINLSFFNPYNTSIQYIIFMIFHNVTTFEINRLSIPYGSVVNSRGDSKEIYIKRRFKSFSHHEIKLYLPLLISNCDVTFINFLFFGLLVSTTVFALFSVLTVIYLFKE